jgi:hypothetical protein
MPKWKSSDYYRANMSNLLDHLAVAEDELKYLESLPQTPKRKCHGMSQAAHLAQRKRQVISGLHRAIQSRISWHRQQVAIAAAVGIVADENFEPKLKTIAYPAARGSAHA